MNRDVDSPTFFLFARPSFWSGFGDVLDLFGTRYNRYNRSMTPEQADYFAIKSDWMAIGDDLRAAMAQMSEESADLAEAR